MAYNNLPPGPNGYALIGSYLDFKKTNLLDYTTQLTSAYGDIVHVKLGPKHVIIFSNPNDVKHILENSDNKYDKPKSADAELIASDSLNLLPTSDKWLKESLLFSSCLDNITLEQHEAELDLQLTELFEKWNNAPTNKNISMDMLGLTMAVMEKLMLHVKPQHYNVQEINKNKYIVVNKAITRSLSLIKCPVFMDRELSHSLDYKHQLVKNIVEEYLKNPDENSYLAKIVAKHNIKNMTMDIAKVVSGDVLNALYLGSDPSDKILSWCFYYLSIYLNEKKKLFDEIERFGNKDLKFSDLEAFPCTANFINEVLRLRTPYALIVRNSLEEDLIREYVIPKDTLCIISTLLVHKHLDYWDNPEAFNPDRFEKVKIEENNAFIPFSSGSRPCLGKQFAFRQTMFVLISILRKYDFKLAPYHDYGMKFLGVVTCKSDIQGSVEKRNI